MGEYFSFEQPARGQYADIFLAGIRQELFQTVGPRKYIVIHAPNPVGTRLISVLYACIESSRTAHIGLIDYCQPFLCGKPFRCTVRASVIYYYNGRYRLVLLQTTNISFQKFHSVVGYNYGYNVHVVAIRVVKAFVREDHERKKFQRSNDELMMAGLNVGMKVIAIMPIMMLAMNGATVAVLYLGGKMVMAEGFLLGDLQAFINYIFQILMSVMMVAMALLQLTRAQACAHRINEVLSAEPSVENKPQAQRPAQDELPAPRGRVEFRDVSFKYVASGSGDDVLSHISFHVRPGQFVAIVGGTGTGQIHSGQPAGRL